MTPNEVIGQRVLIEHGWEPEKIVANSHLTHNKGMPDFKCNKNRYVEIKAYSDSNGLSKSQINRFYELIQEGKEIFILTVRWDGKWKLFKYEYRYIASTF